MTNTRCSALEAHCRRVDVLAQQLAARLGWNEAGLRALSESARSHHVCFPTPELLKRLIQGVWGGPQPSAASAGIAPVAGEMARLLELSCLFVERWEYAHFEPVTYGQVVEEMRRLAEDGFFEAGHVDVLGALPLATPAEVLEIARGARFGLCDGLLTPSLLRPLFEGARGEALWQHSLEVARTSQAIAHLSGRVPPDDAYRAGLLHDVGRLAIAALGSDVPARHDRLLEQQVECVFADLLLCGTDHAATGAEILRRWRVAPHIVEAVECHHQPECSEGALASALSLAEHWSGSQEDLPSLARIRFALDKLGLQPQDTRRLAVPDNSNREPIPH